MPSGQSTWSYNLALCDWGKASLSAGFLPFIGVAVIKASVCQDSVSPMRNKILEDTIWLRGRELGFNPQGKEGGGGGGEFFVVLCAPWWSGKDVSALKSTGCGYRGARVQFLAPMLSSSQPSTAQFQRIWCHLPAFIDTRLHTHTHSHICIDINKNKSFKRQSFIEVLAIIILLVQKSWSATFFSWSHS